MLLSCRCPSPRGTGTPVADHGPSSSPATVVKACARRALKKRLLKKRLLKKRLFKKRFAIGALLAGTVAQGAVQAADVRVAFLGDQGRSQATRDVLKLVKDESADLLVLQGDLGYSRPRLWIENMDSILGKRFPVLAVVGNHENVGWDLYRDWLEKRVEDIDALKCDGRIAVKAHCTFRGISVVQTAPGVHEIPGIDADDDYAGYLRDALADDPNVWRICSWHKLQRDMQVGGKTSNSTGWGVYEECRKAGGIVATAHEHSYSRTHLMSDFSEQRVVHRDDHLQVGPGQTFAFVAGLGGNSVRAQQREGNWWGSIYTATQGATHGALFCTFGDRRASCEFKAIDGAVPDRFTLETLNGLAPAAATPTGSRSGGRENEPVTAPVPVPAPVPETGDTAASAIAAPSALVSSRYSSGSGEIFWARPSTFGLQYEVRLDGDVLATTVGTSHYLRGLAKGRAYTYEIVALDGRGRRSAPATVTLSGIKGESSGGTGPTTAAPPIASADPALSSAGSGGTITRASTSVPGNLEVRLDVYGRRSYELFWERVSGIPRYRLSSDDGEVVQDAAGTSRYFRRVDTSLETVYRIEAINRDGRTVRETRVLVAPARSAQLAAVD